MKGLRRYLQSPLSLVLAGLACFGAGALSAKLIGEAGLLFWWPAFAFMVLAVATSLRRSGDEEDAISNAFEHVDKRLEDMRVGRAHGYGPYGSHHEGSRSFDVSEISRG